MRNLSNSTQRISYSYFRRMCGYYFLYKKYYEEDPEIIPIEGDYIMFQCFENMLNRTSNYVKEHKQRPNSIIINPYTPKNHPQPAILASDEISKHHVAVFYMDKKRGNNLFTP